MDTRRTALKTSLPLAINQKSKIEEGEGDSIVLSVRATPPTVPPTEALPAHKKHKPYWLNGHYYENPEYPEHIARAIFARGVVRTQLSGKH